MPDNYPSASEMVRNLAQIIRTPYQVVFEEGKFRVVRFAPPFWDGYEFWVVNEKGFLWEPADSQEQAIKYLQGDEAKEYQGDA